VKVDRGAVRVVSHGSSEPRRATVASAANGAGGRAPGTPRRRAEAAANPLVGTTAFRDWSYRGETGPAHWARLNPEWAACAADIPQAPIDIREGIAVGLPPIEFDLPPAKLTILDDGRAIRAVVREGPGIVTLGRRFELREITFHQPAEFRIEGRTFDLSAHLLHRDEDGRAAVVVVLFEVGDASTPRNPVVQTVLDYLPLAQDMLMPVPERRDLRELLPADPGYYNFVGALSSPPCTAGVVWMVMREPLRIPPSQVAIFARVHPMNVRPLQPLAGRLIKQSE
jgi:carbonic anhydrase